MLITVTRSGGFTGVEKTRGIDTSQRRDARELEQLARRAVPSAADSFHYRIAVDDQVFDLEGPTLTEEQRELVRTVLGEGA
ncbi:protealysin inhibitor emfourin [Streptomyces sp. cmx-4-9]|uniref:protealysin inhibitor emfourin n=1 Tax=Streptomyces sp. cmx-4-9 TaxID=2790941 RepID=UPI00397F29A4